MLLINSFQFFVFWKCLKIAYWKISIVSCQCMHTVAEGQYTKVYILECIRCLCLPSTKMYIFKMRTNYVFKRGIWLRYAGPWPRKWHNLLIAIISRAAVNRTLYFKIVRLKGLSTRFYYTCFIHLCALFILILVIFYFPFSVLVWVFVSCIANVMICDLRGYRCNCCIQLSCIVYMCYAPCC